MPGILRSPRWRRRLLFAGVPLVVALTVVAAGIKWSNTAPTEAERLTAAGQPPAPPPREIPVRVKDGNAALNVAASFIRTAVMRRRVGDSYDLVTPGFRQGLTRAEWASGQIPVVPFPVRVAKWELDYSIQNGLGLKVALFPTRGSGQRATVFTVDMLAVGSGDKRRWLVDAFTPTGTPPPSAAAGTTSGLPRFDKDRLAGGSGRLGAGWLLVPVGILALILLVPLVLGIAYWHRGVRAERAYARERFERS